MHTVEQLRGFVAVYDAGSYSAAAKRLKRDRTTVRDTVKNLEDVWGVTLFEVQGRTAVATTAADALYFQAKVLLRQNEKLLQHSRVVMEQDILELNIAVNNQTPVTFILDLEEYLFFRFPSVVVNWLRLSREEALNRIMEGECHLACLETRGSFFPEKEVTFFQLGYVDFFAYVAPDSPLVSCDPLTPLDLQREVQYINELDIRNKSMVSRLSENCRQVGSDDLICELISRRGWAIIPEDIARCRVEQGTIVKLDTKGIMATSFQFPISFFYLAGTEKHNVVGDSIDWVRQHAPGYFR